MELHPIRFILERLGGRNAIGEAIMKQTVEPVPESPKEIPNYEPDLPLPPYVGWDGKVHTGYRHERY